MKAAYDKCLEDKVIRPLKKVLGRHLLAIDYWVIASDDTNLEEPNSSGGCQAIFLVLDGNNLEINWGWEAAFLNEQITYHILMRSDLTTPQTSESLIPLSATGVKPWRNLVGQTLTNVEVLGFEGSPQAVHFKFSLDSVVISIGYADAELWLGNGDELLVLTDLDLIPKEWRVIWRAKGEDR